LVFFTTYKLTLNLHGVFFLALSYIQGIGFVTYPMPVLENLTHERFCSLIAETGDTPAVAYGKVAPTAKTPKVYASTLIKRTDIISRIAEIRTEVATRSVAVIGRKRELLRLMIEGAIPTKVVNRASGVEETFDKLAAMALDAKLAGELSDQVHLTANSELKLNFTVRDRDSRTIDGNGVMDAVIIPDANETLALPDANEPEIEFTHLLDDDTNSKDPSA
jgi:hypothetical protein